MSYFVKRSHCFNIVNRSSNVIMFQWYYAAWGFLILPVLAMVYYFRFKDRGQLWQTFQAKKDWSTAIRLSSSDHYFWKKTCVLLALCFIVIALMRPQYGEHYETVEREGRQIFFIVDTSLSMLAEDGAKTRLELAKYHIQQLIPKINDDFMSIVPYANTAYTYLPLTSDYSAVDLFLDDIFVGMIGSSGSDIMNALTVVRDAIKTNKINQSATLIIFSDGEFTPRVNQDKIDDMFRGVSIQSMVVGLGSLQGEPIPQRGENNEIIKYKKDGKGNIILSKRIDEQLERLAESLNGIVVEGEVSPLVAEKLYQHLSKIETQQLEEKQLVTKIDRYHWFLFIALLFLVIEYLVPKLQMKYAKQILFILLLIAPSSIHAAHPGVKAYQNQDFQKAQNQFKSSLTQSPDNGKLAYNLGNTYFKLGDHDKAIKAYEEALVSLSEKEKIDAYYNLGTAHLNRNNVEQALIAYKEVLKRDPNHLRTKQNIEMVLRKKK